MTSTPHETGAVAATVTDASELDVVLCAAIENLRSASPQNTTKGILITAHAPGSFSVDLSDDVPYGLTRESYAY